MTVFPAMVSTMETPYTATGASGSGAVGSGGVRKTDKETLWKDLFKNPGSWRDYRPKKARDELSPNFPDLKHNVNSEWSLWAGGAYGNPFKWVQAELDSDKYQFVDPDPITLQQLLPSKRAKVGEDIDSPS